MGKVNFQLNVLFHPFGEHFLAEMTLEKKLAIFGQEHAGQSEPIGLGLAMIVGTPTTAPKAAGGC